MTATVTGAAGSRRLIATRARLVVILPKSSDTVRAVTGGDVTALFINGTVGSGKTTTAEAVGTILREHQVAHAIIDLDALRAAWPAPVADPFNLDLEIKNTTAVAANYRAAGANRLVLAGVLERPGDRARYETAVAGRILVCRLLVASDEIRRRLISRHAPGPELQWHLKRAIELDAILDAAEVDDLECEPAQKDPTHVAEQLVHAVGWV